jgi:hypothetical protein
MAAAFLVATLAVAGCGSGEDLSSGCSFGEPGESIDLENSQLTCEEANAMLNVLPAVRRPQMVGPPDNQWRCTYLPESELPRRIVCSQEKKRLASLDEDE